MKEVTGAVIATSLVLVAVFVPVAFFPGTTGILFRQFALTIAFSIAISAFNALTLAPCSRSASARPLARQKRTGSSSWSTASRRHQQRLCSRSPHFLRFEVLALILFAAGLGLAYFVFKQVPQGFVPNEDQGYLIVAIQAPTGASLEYTRKIGRQVSAITKNIPEIRGTFAIAGFSFGGALPTPASSSCRFSPTQNARAKSTPPPPSSSACAARCSESPAPSSSPSNRPPCRVSASSAASNTNSSIRAITPSRISTKPPTT
jgi:multidrug efflux pump subunit AcrB